MLVEPSYLFSASPEPEPGQPSLGDASLPLRCQVVIHALRAGKPVSWEVTASLESLLQPREGPGREDPPRRVAKAWDKPLHRLAARSVVRDNESVAQREAKLEQGGCWSEPPRRLRHPPRSNRLAPGRFCPPVPPESRANQQSLQRAFRLHPPGARGRCHAGSPARSPRGVGHRYGQGAGGMGRGQQGDRGLRWHQSLSAGSASRTRAAAAGNWHHRSSSAGQGQQQDVEEQDEAPGTAGTDSDFYVNLCSPGICTGVSGDPQLMAVWGWSCLECCGYPERGICPILERGVWEDSSCELRRSLEPGAPQDFALLQSETRSPGLQAASPPLPLAGKSGTTQTVCPGCSGPRAG